MLTDVDVSAALQSRRLALQTKHELTTDRILQELSRIAFADLRKAFAPDGSLLSPAEWPDDVAAAMAGVDVVETKTEAGAIPEYTKKVKLWDKNAAIEKAMKHLGLFDQDNAQRKPQVIINASPTDEGL